MKLKFEELNDSVTIHYSDSFGYYIFIHRWSGNNQETWYIHRDGTIHINCGEKNFHKSFESAVKFLIDLREKLNTVEVIIDGYKVKITKDVAKIDDKQYGIKTLESIIKLHKEIK